MKYVLQEVMAVPLDRCRHVAAPGELQLPWPENRARIVALPGDPSYGPYDAFDSTLFGAVRDEVELL